LKIKIQIFDYTTILFVVMALLIAIFIMRYEKMFNEQKIMNKDLILRFELPAEPEYYKKEVLHKL
jgi:hypothetical protein